MDMDEPICQGPDGTPLKRAKDKKCPFCGQAFTSSSLGRHLDLYIREHNPKAPDGIHNVDEIQKMRGTITRRQHRGSLGGNFSRRNSSTPVRRTAPRKESSLDSGGTQSPAIPRDGQFAVDSFPVVAPWEASWDETGVTKDAPGNENLPSGTTGRPNNQRSASRQVNQKTQLDAKQRLTDAVDTARAAELALREILSSWRAAKHHLDNQSGPFDFDPLSFDFPALTLQCLKPPPTLFSSTQHPTSTSWSTAPPGQREFDALNAHFKEEFRAWKISSATATAATLEELTYPPSDSTALDSHDALGRAQESADNLEEQVSEHVRFAYAAWEGLPPERKQELWILELARGVGRRQKEMTALKDEQHRLKQENVNLKTQIAQLNHQDQPKEFRMLTPSTLPIGPDVVFYAYEQGVKGGKGLGFNLEDRHLDLNTLVGKSIERWKDVVVSGRASSGMKAQKPLEPQTNGVRKPSAKAAARSKSTVKSQAQAKSLQSQTQTQGESEASTPQAGQQMMTQCQDTAGTTGVTAMTSDQTPIESTTGPPSIEETSDQDADAEMEDEDSFALINASPTKPIQQQPAPQQTLEIPRTRGHMQSQQQQQQQHRQHQHQQQHAQQQQQQQQQPQQQQMHDPRFMMQNGGASPVNARTLNMRASMPNMNMALPGNALHTEMAMAMQGYME